MGSTGFDGWPATAIEFYEAHGAKGQPDFATTAKGPEDKTETDEPADEYNGRLGF